MDKQLVAKELIKIAAALNAGDKTASTQMTLGTWEALDAASEKAHKWMLRAGFDKGDDPDLETAKHIIMELQYVEKQAKEIIETMKKIKK